MFKFFLLAALIAVAAADGDDVHAETTFWKSEVRHDGFESAVETSNQIHQVASGDEHGNIHGDFSWVDPKGVKVDIKYVADEHGYHPEGDIIPTPHPIPEAILKAIQYIQAHPSKEEPHH